MQEILVFVIVAAAAVYVAWNAVRRLRAGKARPAACSRGCGNCRGCG